MPRSGASKGPDDRIRVQHMLVAAQQALVFIRDRARADLDSDDMLRRALKDCIQEIGEAASRLTPEGRARAANLPWNQIVGMRHILVHGYYSVDRDALWSVAAHDLPPLIRELEIALARWDDSAPDPTSA